MKHWEYKILELPGNKDVTNENILDDWGSQGWVLVQIVGKKAFMKRENEKGWVSG
jgi:hypothetical protein